MKKIFGLCVCLTLCALCFCSCNFVSTDDNAVTGDVRQEIDQIQSTENENVNDDTTDIQQEIRENVTDTDDIIKSLGGNSVLRGGDSAESAQSFCEAVVTADSQKIADFTNGNPSYYEFLSDINIKYYSLYPFVLGESARKYAEENGLYIGATDMYIAEFDVENADGEYFHDGKNFYYLEFSFSDFEFDESVTAFVPYDLATKVMYGKMDMDFTDRFVSETISLMDNQNNIQDGKNNADSFSFDSYSAVHYITHLMARSGKYPDTPPYSMDEIDEFVENHFDGHNGVGVNSAESLAKWIYPMLEEQKTEYSNHDRAFGCSYAHGGTVSEYSILQTEEKDGVLTVDVQLYADFSNFAKAKKLTFLFDKKEDESVTLLGIVQSDNKNRTVAGMTF